MSSDHSHSVEPDGSAIRGVKRPYPRDPQATCEDTISK